jgi:hypothetical protein
MVARCAARRCSRLTPFDPRVLAPPVQGRLTKRLNGRYDPANPNQRRFSAHGRRRPGIRKEHHPWTSARSSAAS